MKNYIFVDAFRRDPYATWGAHQGAASVSRAKTLRDTHESDAHAPHKTLARSPTVVSLRRWGHAQVAGCLPNDGLQSLVV